jgi:HK97 family phage major capsid protein
MEVKMENQATYNFTADEIKSIITASVLEAFKQSNATKPDVKLESEEKNPTTAFSKSLKNAYNLLIGKAANPMTEGTAPDGGYLVPDVTKPKILELLETYGQARKLFTIMPMGNNPVIHIPKVNTGATAYFVNEGATATSSKPTLGQLTLTAKKLVGIVAVSRELMEDAIVDVSDFIINQLAKAIAKKEDEACFSDATPFTGIFSTGVTASDFGHSADLSGNISNLSYDVLLDAVYGLDQSLLTGAKWAMHRTIFAKIRELKDSNGRPLIYDANAGNPATLFGYPVVLIENAPAVSGTLASKPYVVFGNFENSIFGVRSEVTYEVSKEATVDGTSLWQNGLVGILMQERVAFNPGLLKGYSAIFGA